MCGGIGFSLDKVARQDIDVFLSEVELDRYSKTGMAHSFYWDKRPILPMISGDAVRLIDWGNRNGSAQLPKTGWARIESIDAGRWNKVDSSCITIPALLGYEKGVWFPIAGRGIAGLLINDNDSSYAYMITKQASKKYQLLTGYDREPLFER